MREWEREREREIKRERNKEREREKNSVREKKRGRERERKKERKRKSFSELDGENEALLRGIRSNKECQWMKFYGGRVWQDLAKFGHFG